MVKRIPIIPSVARELLYRLTEALEIPFTLTDHNGIVMASTAGRPAGQVDPYALSAVRHGSVLEITEQQLVPPAQTSMVSPAVEHAGLLPPEPGVYSPISIGGEITAVLITRGQPETLRYKAMSAAAAAGLGLEFASTATFSTRETLGPNVALRTLLRGNQREARRALLLVKVAGWDLLLPRGALAITPVDAERRLPASALGVVRELLDAIAPHTPFGQLSADEWVALPALPQSDAQLSLADVARQIQETMAAQDADVLIGIGETHIDLPILPGLRRSYQEGSFCVRSARRLNSPAGVYSLRSLGLLAFLAPGTTARERFARQLLEPLQASPDVLATVQVFLDADLSVETAAKRSGQHRHTVRSHLQRARELTGLDPRILGDAVQLKLALLLSMPVQTV